MNPKDIKTFSLNDPDAYLVVETHDGERTKLYQGDMLEVVDRDSGRVIVISTWPMRPRQTRLGRRLRFAWQMLCWGSWGGYP